MALTKVSRGLLSTGIVDNSTTTAITIDSSENVGIGTSSSSIDGTLHVHTASAGTVTASPQADDLVIENGAEGGMTIITPDDQSARIRFTSPSTTADVGGATIFYRQNINKMSMGTEVAGGILALKSGAGSEGLLLDSSGNVGIGSGANPISHQLVSYKTGANANYIQIASGSTGIGATNGFRLGVSSAGLGEIYSQSASPTMTFSSGNVGIGTSSITSFSGYTSLEINNAVNGSILDLSQGDTMRGRFIATSSSMALETSGSIPIVFQPAGTEVMRIAADGQVGVSSRKGFRFGYNQLQGNAGSSGGGYSVIGYNIRFTENSGDYGTLVGDTSWRIDIGDNARLQVHSRSSAAAVSSQAAYTAGPYVALNGTTWTGGSDERLKENVSTITGADAIAKVKAMRPVNYSWIHDSESANQLGFIAQEMLSAVPEVVDVPETETDPITQQTLMWGITYDRLIPVLTAALQEALTKIETLEAKVQTLENN